MKNFTFILLALIISGTTFAQNSATSSGTATVNAEIVSPISVTDGTELNFGRIIGNTDGGTVTVATDGGRTASVNDLLAPSTSVQAASFTVKAAAGYNYSISIPGIDLTGAGDDMSLTFTNNLGTESVQGTGADQTLNVGGALTVNPGQVEGDYTGTVEVTVAYE